MLEVGEKMPLVVKSNEVIRETGPKEQSPKQAVFEVCTPRYSFDDVILSDTELNKILNIIQLYNYNSLIYDQWGLNKVMKKNSGLKILLYGESGTGKSITAEAIAKELKKHIIRVNYAEIESRFVGETSKNLVRLFEIANKEDAVLLFDEADALLSKRVVSMMTAADVSVNQTRNVLLQLVDEYFGVIIFTTNFISNIDKAFIRRALFQVKFELPNTETRRKLWQHFLVDQLPLSCAKEEFIDSIDVYSEATGADISNAVLKAAVIAASREEKFLKPEDVKTALKEIETEKDDNNGKLQIIDREVSTEYANNKIEKALKGDKA